MRFPGLLNPFVPPEQLRPGSPAATRDLALDVLFDAVAARFPDAGLPETLRLPCADERTVRWRQEVFADLAVDALAASVRGFYEAMAVVQRHRRLVERLRSREQRHGWALTAVLEYCRAVEALRDGLEGASVASPALRSLATYLADHTASPEFGRLVGRARELRAALERVEFAVLVRGPRVTVGDYDGEPDYGAVVTEVFDRLRDEAREPVSARLAPAGAEMDHVEAQIVGLVGRLHPELFAELEQFCLQHEDFVDTTLAQVAADLVFFLAVDGFYAPLRAAGLAVCLPRLLPAEDRRLRADAVFDAALAHRLVHEGQPVVCSDLHLDPGERIVVVTGPNQGGKTTFARSIGQLHHLAMLGCPVPAAAAELCPVDAVLTHFEVAPDPQDLAGGLMDDLQRVREVLSAATSASLLVFNEVFSSTSLLDATALSEAVLRRLAARGSLAVWVTFIPELVEAAAGTVSMASDVDPADVSHRTFRMTRRPPNERAYADALAARYELGYDQVRARLA
ncbi:MAG TPA: hypothetical protein VFR99_05685 [Marmoricola sp.]|nr:hypothetical protein [Marmoricola sp.]